MPSDSTPISEPQNSSQAIAQLEIDPFLIPAWQALLNKVKQQQDVLSTQSLEIILEGLVAASQNRADCDRLPVRDRSTLIRLAKAYNNPTLLLEVGTLYLRHFNLPGIASRHFERAQRLGGPEKQLAPLLEAAAVAEQKRLAQAEGKAAAHTGISIAPNSRPSANRVIVETGKRLSMNSDWNITSVLPAQKVAVGESLSSLVLPSTTAACLEAAAQAMQERKLKPALAYLLEANKDPADRAKMWRLWGELGVACHEARSYEEMDVAFTQALHFSPGDLGTCFNAGLGSHLNRRFDVALDLYQKAAELGPTNAKVWCNLGVLFFQMNRYVNSETALSRSTELDPKYLRAWDNFAATLVALEKTDEALAACRAALQINPDYPETHFKLGVIFFQRFELTLSAEAFRRASVLNPVTAYCDCYLSSIHSQWRQPQAAEEAVARATAANPQCELLWMAWNDLGLVWYEMGDYTRASLAYAEATILKPDEARTWFNLGVTYHSSGELRAARDAYQQAIDLPSYYTGAWHNLGLVCAQLGDFGAARAAFTEEVNLEPTNGRAWYDFAVCLQQMGRNDEAAHAFARAEHLGKVATGQNQFGVQN